MKLKSNALRVENGVKKNILNEICIINLIIENVVIVNYEQLAKMFMYYFTVQGLRKRNVLSE